MSQRLGGVERTVLGVLREVGESYGYRTRELADLVEMAKAGDYQPRPATAATYASTRRAVRKLYRDGYIRTAGRDRRGKFWSIVPEPGRKPHDGRMSAADRDRLVKLLGMLGSHYEGERAAAGLKAEQLRRRLGLSWEQLLKPGER